MRPVESWIMRRAELRTNTSRSHWVQEWLYMMPLGLGWPVPVFGYDRSFLPLRGWGWLYNTSFSTKNREKDAK